MSAKLRLSPVLPTLAWTGNAKDVLYVHIDGNTHHPGIKDANIESWTASAFAAPIFHLSHDHKEIATTSSTVVMFIQSLLEARTLTEDNIDTTYNRTYLIFCNASRYDTATRYNYSDTKYDFWKNIAQSIIDSTRADMDRGHFGTETVNAIQVQSFNVIVPKFTFTARYGTDNEYYDVKQWSYFVQVSPDGFMTYFVGEIENVPRDPSEYDYIEWTRATDCDLTLRADYFTVSGKRIFPISGVNLPNNYRNLVITKQLMHPVAPGYNSYSMFMNSFTLQVLRNLLDEVEQPLTLDLVIYHSLTTQVLFTMRILRSYSEWTTNYIVNVGDSSLKYATLKSPPELMYIGDVKIVTPSQYLPVMDVSDLADNVVYPNAGMALGMIGGSAISGIGAGISGYFQYRGNKEMTELNWQKKLELESMNWKQRQGMQNQTFDFQKSMQGNQFDFSKMMQAKQFEQQNLMQSYNWDNSFLYQQRNQDFAREMAGYNQNLAGYRTGGAVAGVNTRYHPRTQSGTQTTTNDSGRVISTDPSRWGQGPRSSMSTYGRLATNTTPQNNTYY